jgi:hypothetical protein
VRSVLPQFWRSLLWVVLYGVAFWGTTVVIGGALGLLCRPWCRPATYWVLGWTGVTWDQQPVFEAPLIALVAPPALLVGALVAAWLTKPLGWWRLLLPVWSVLTFVDDLMGVDRLTGGASGTRVEGMILNTARLHAGGARLVWLALLLSIPGMLVATWLATLLPPPRLRRKLRICDDPEA